MSERATGEVTAATRTVVTGVAPPARRFGTYRLCVVAPDGTEEAHRMVSPTVRVGSREGNDLVVADRTVSRLHFEITGDASGYRLRDLGSKNGTIVDGHRAADIYLHDGSTIRLGSCRIVFRLDDQEVDIPSLASDRFGPLIGKSLAMRELFAILARAAPTEATVLIEGESGTGKEVVARAIHEASTRAGAPLTTFDCGAVPASLIESELFGHEKGAFTGADASRLGILEEADGGTLFLDEIGELPLDLQPKLLRALESREVRRVGGRKPIPIDVRIVAATNRDLASEINRGTFREDLYYRLAVIRVVVPALRDRPEDVPLLVSHFVRRALGDDLPRARRFLDSVGDDQWGELMSHGWPGNVRELRNVIDRAMALQRTDEAIDLSPEARRARARSTDAEDAPIELDLSRTFGELKADHVARFERAYLFAQLKAHGGNITHAARASGLERTQFKRLLRKHGG